MEETLRELTEEYASVLSDCYKEESVSDELVDRLKNINERWDKKFQNLVNVVQEIEIKCDAVDKEITRLTGRLERWSKNLSAIKEYMKSEMISLGKTKIETPTHSISLRESSPVDVDEKCFIAYALQKKLTKFLRIIPEKIEPDRIAIKSHILAGNELQYARITKKQNLNIR